MNKILLLFTNYINFILFCLIIANKLIVINIYAIIGFIITFASLDYIIRKAC